MHSIIMKVIGETLQVTLLVLLMMVLVDIINVWTRGKIALLLKQDRQWRQYVVSSAIGTVPGCVGGFTNVSLYIHGMISFGALVGSMAAASGDEAFIMLAMFPKTALILFALLFVTGVVTGFLVDKFVKKANIKTCQDCPEILYHHEERSFQHYIKDHIWKHIIRQHLWKTALWTFGALIIVEFGMSYWHFDAISSQYTFVLLLLGAAIGLIPESGPHLLFVTMFANGLIPFSVLFTSSFVQDGHSMLPMLSYSVKDSIYIKIFNITFGVAIGSLLYIIGF
ncbi:MAG: arsenic efflux protein [Bacteroidetes bacterium]|nr:arsenic efflux protein [Bacteroidota bacterium]